MQTNNSILVIGHPDSGKTTFLAQFLTRVRQGKSSIKLYKIPENIKAISDAITRLSEGKGPIPTSADDNVKLVLPIEIDDEKFDLTCPDYGGEQVSNVTDLMEIDDYWNKLIKDSDSWILFIRASKISPEYDLSISSYEEIDAGKSSDFTGPELSEQSKFIELLQAFLYAKNKGIKHSVSNPKISIVLSCWDELKTQKTPREILKNKLPMLLRFVETVWSPNSIKILGLSSQEFPLDTEKAQDKYLDELPENFGYLIDVKGKKDLDITRIIKLALQ